MKELVCAVCGKYLGEIIEGRIHKRAIVLCVECHFPPEDHRRGDMPDFLKDLFKGKL